MAPIEFILILIELLLIMMLLAMLLTEFFRARQPAPDTTKGKEEQESGEVQTIHPERKE